MAKQKESLVRDAIVQYLDTRKDVYYWVNRNTSAYLGGGKFGNPPKGFKYGVADIIVIQQVKDYLPYLLGIECKSDTGGQTETQIFFESGIVSKGAFYLIARSVNPVQEWIEAKDKPQSLLVGKK